MEQLAIALCGVTSIFLTQSRSERLRRWACIFGLAGQPFWFLAALTAEQWGILALTFLYAAAWARGFYNHWIKK